MTKRIVLCADDYGQAPEISQGILQLIQQHRLSATSCMVNTPYFAPYAKELIPYQAGVDIGLHLNLTEGQALSPLFKEVYGERLFSLTTLMRKAILHQLNRVIIAAEYEAQIDYFADVMGSLPNFIDGHQHVHQFPVLREVLLHVYERRFSSQKMYIRLANEKPSMRFLSGYFKKQMIYLMGANTFKHLLERKRIPHNTSFSGMYSFSHANQYRQFFLHFLKEIKNDGLIMCHPGLFSLNKNTVNRDPIVEARYLEYQYFASDQWVEDSECQGLMLRKFFI